MGETIKIHYEPFHGKVLFKTPKYNEYFKENFREFDALEFIAEVTAHIPPKHKQYIRRYGLYASRTRGIWDRSPHVMRLAPEGWKQKRNETSTSEISNTEIPENVIDEKKKRSTWARLIKKVYGTDPLVCPECGSEMKIIAIIMDTEETTRILEHLVKIGRPPPNFDPAFLN